MPAKKSILIKLSPEEKVRVENYAKVFWNGNTSAYIRYAILNGDVNIKSYSDEVVKKTHAIWQTANNVIL